MTVLSLLGAALGPDVALAAGPIGAPLVISADPEQEVSTSVAYNEQRREYLVVWFNDRPGCDDIRARRLSKDGLMLGSPFYVSAGCPADRRFPDVAYDSVDDQYLVVWEQSDPASGTSIRARRVSGDGQILDPNDLIIRSSGYNLYTPATPAVAYAFTDNRYLVVWSEAWHPMPITYDIYGQVVTSAGALEGNRFAISEGSQARQQPDLAYNRHANRYLVVWQLDAGAQTDVHGQQVHGAGGLYKGDVTIAYYTASSTVPAVAALATGPTASTFLVVWELHYAPGDHDIYGQWVAEDGTLGAGLVLINSLDDESAPAVAASEGGQHFLVTWRQSRGVLDKSVMAQPLSPGGAALSPAIDFPCPAADRPALAAGPLSDWLLVWQDQPVAATSTHLYGRLWGNRTLLPMVVRDPQP